MSNKYHAKTIFVHGFRFDSKREAARYQELLLLEAAGEIKIMDLHPRYKLEVNGVLIGHYTGDFKYIENGKLIIEDVKGVRTRDYILRKKLMKAIHNIDIREVK